MDAAQALAELTELSSQVEGAAVLRADGSVLASTEDDPQATERLMRAGLDLVTAAFELNTSPQEVIRVDVELADGSLFVIREGGRTIAATTGPQPTTGLVVYDLRTCLQRIREDPEPKRKRTTRKPKEPE
ncbi:MAG TPA: roadblock/LC7 domain-containing protein [Gaiellaceae bacterium]|nr:roadblock/LC7 domain-containing protein [Gaiellaceae bacterium]